MNIIDEHVRLYDEFMKYVKYLNEFVEITKEKKWSNDIYIQKLKYLMTPIYVNKIDIIRKEINIIFTQIIKSKILPEIMEEYKNIDKRINLITNALIRLHQNKFTLEDKQILEYYYKQDINKEKILLDLPDVPNDIIYEFPKVPTHKIGHTNKIGII
jgi:hypothetical protein